MPLPARYSRRSALSGATACLALAAAEVSGRERSPVAPLLGLATPAAGAPTRTERRPIGLIVAMGVEFQHFLDETELLGEETDGSWRYLYLQRNGRLIVAMHSGIGMVNAAACTDQLLSNRQLEAVFNYGSAGAHERRLHPGDLVIGTATINQGVFIVRPDGEIMYRDKGATSFGESVEGGSRPCDRALIALAEASAEHWTPPPWPANLPWPTDIPRRDPITVTGIVASSGIWTQSAAWIDTVHAQLDSLCEDMEAAAINQVCHRHGVPFLTIKDITNNELLASSNLQGKDAARPASLIGRNSCALILRVLDALPR